MLSSFSCTCLPLVCLLWRNVYLKPLPICKSGNLFVLLLSDRSSLYVLNINLLLDMWFPNIFSHSAGCLSLCCGLCCTETSKCDVIPRVYSCFCHISKKSSLILILRSSSPLFSSRNFTVSGLTFHSVNHFELIFMNDVRWGQISFFSKWISIFLKFLCWRHHLCPMVSFWHLVENHFTVHERVYFWALRSGTSSPALSEHLHRGSHVLFRKLWPSESSLY